MASRRALSLFSALFSTSTASSSNPSARQLKDMAIKDFVTVSINLLPVMTHALEETPFYSNQVAALALTANHRRK
jgi:hypothetical protein